MESQAGLPRRNDFVLAFYNGIVAHFLLVEHYESLSTCGFHLCTRSAQDKATVQEQGPFQA